MGLVRSKINQLENQGLIDFNEFRIELQPGRTTLQTWLTDRHGAYYVDVRRLTKG